MAAKFFLAAMLLVPAVFQDARRFNEAVGLFQKMSASKDPFDRARAASELGNHTFEKVDRTCWQLLSGHLHKELDRENKGRNEEEVSGDVLDACVLALRKITHKEVIDEMTRFAKAPIETPRYRAYLVLGLSVHGALKDLAELADDKAPHVSIAAVDALTERADKSSLALFLKVIKDDKWHWTAKLAAFRGIDRVGDKEIVDTLIEGLGAVKSSEGRLKDEYVKILKKLVEVDLVSDNPDVWKAAWLAKRDGKALGKHATVVEEPTTFFGLQTKSTRILFVIDRTGSMVAPIQVSPSVPRKKDSPSVPAKESLQETAARGEAEKLKKKYDERQVKTRMDRLKKEFVNTIWDLDEKVWFGVVWYAYQAELWKDHPLPATWVNKLEIIRETDKLQPLGGTNIWDGLEMAYKMMDRKGNYAMLLSGADTFYLMTDGTHNVGKFLNPTARRPEDRCDIPAFLSELRKVNKLRKVVIHTICLGSETPPKEPDMLADPKLMQKIAEETGGEFVHIKG